jgi:hypothetical protein
MAEALFYHLTESTLEQALPPLLEKSLQRGWAVVVQTAPRSVAMRWTGICGPFATIRSWLTEPTVIRTPPSSPSC